MLKKIHIADIIKMYNYFQYKIHGRYRENAMSIELWDILDENGNPTGKTALRGKNTLKSGEYHLVVHIWIVSHSGSFLIQRRSESKKLMPGEWAATGGAAITGEDSFTAASRELFEELGITSTPQTLKKITRIKRRNSLLDVWVIFTDIDRDSLVLQRSEVAEAKWVDLDGLKNMISSGNFHNYGSDYFDTVFNAIENYRTALA